MNVDILLGKTTEHLVPLEGTRFSIHKQMLQDFLRLQKEAAANGFDLQIASAFRDYERQLRIWNMKVQGERPVYDDNGNLLDVSTLSRKELLHAILRWSALPGASRHHWGTDIDVFDAKTQSAEEVKLVPEECENCGPAARMHEWLDDLIARNASYGFYRPYRTDRGGVAPERWHLSHYSLARRIHESLTFSIFRKNIEDTDMLLKDEILEDAHDIYLKYFLNIDLP